MIKILAMLIIISAICHAENDTLIYEWEVGHLDINGKLDNSNNIKYYSDFIFKDTTDNSKYITKNIKIDTMTYKIITHINKILPKISFDSTMTIEIETDLKAYLLLNTGMNTSYISTYTLEIEKYPIGSEKKSTYHSTYFLVFDTHKRILNYIENVSKNITMSLISIYKLNGEYIIRYIDYPEK